VTISQAGSVQAGSVRHHNSVTITLSNLRSYLGEVPGMLELRWDAAEGAHGYIVEVSSNVMPRQFSLLRSCSKTKLLLENLTLGETYVFRIATQGANNALSLWSVELIRGVA